MNDSQGYDDQFDGHHRISLHNSRRERPDKWPKSVSEMRHHTSYGGQGMDVRHDTGHSVYMARRPLAYAPRVARHAQNNWAWLDTR